MNNMLKSWIINNNALWDVFLAVVPVCLAYTMLWSSKLPVRKYISSIFILLLASAWFIFLPNTCYLLTEWRHFLSQVDGGNLYILAHADKFMYIQLCGLGLFYFLFSGIGLITFTLSIRPIERMLAAHKMPIWYWAMPFFTALAIGVYLGLVRRFNSWNVVDQPEAIWKSLLDIPHNPFVLLFIIGFALFLWVVYESVDIWIDGLSERWSKVTGKRFHLAPREKSEKSIDEGIFTEEVENK